MTILHDHPLVGKLVCIVMGPFNGFRGTVFRVEKDYGDDGDDEEYLRISLTEKAFKKARIVRPVEYISNCSMSSPATCMGVVVPKKYVEVIS